MEPAGSTAADFPAGILAGWRQQRDQAQACFGLSLAISLAILLANFGGRPTRLADLQTQIEAHREMLAATQQLIRTNERELQRSRTELTSVRKAVGWSKP